VLRRVGALGPDPANISVWSAERFQDFEGLARSAPAGAGASIKVAGFYRQLGNETV
jgi:hypothetical protein